MHRTLADHGLERGMEGYAIHRSYDQDQVAVPGIGKGLAADEMSERVHLVVDGIDGRVHYAEMERRWLASTCCTVRELLRKRDRNQN